jgi:hypothetical protein
MNGDLIQSIEELISRIRTDSSTWPQDHLRWFRGEPNVATRLVPKLYRQLPYPNENQLLQNFRAMAPSFAASTPVRGATDEWLCLAQHVGLPTRLLDWTESALFAVHFALRETEPVVWMLNPIELNALSVNEPAAARVAAELPLPWHQSLSPNVVNIGSINIRGAWERDDVGVPFPVAFVPTHVHPRMAAQRSRFTVWGLIKESLQDMVEPTVLRRFALNPARRALFQADLRMLGVQEASAFPDLDGLARELEQLFTASNAIPPAALPLMPGVGRHEKG